MAEMSKQVVTKRCDREGIWRYNHYKTLSELRLIDRCLQQRTSPVSNLVSPIICPMSLVNAEFVSYPWESTSTWSAKELNLLHVDNVVVDQLLDEEVADHSDSRLAKLLNNLPYDALEFDKLITTDDDFEDCFLEKYSLLAKMFYDQMYTLITTKNSRMEAESPLNALASSMQVYIQSVGSAIPIGTDTDIRASLDSVVAQAGSPPESRKNVQFEEDKSPPAVVSTKVTQRPLPSALSASSVKFAEMGTKEAATEHALGLLLEFIIQEARFKVLQFCRTHTDINILFGASQGPRSINDGSIILNAKVPKSNVIPLINIECKSRQGSTGAEIMSKIAGQEFGEMLAIVQKRYHQSRWSSRDKAINTVYTVAMHGRQAYLARVDFDSEYLEATASENLMDLRITVKRTKRSYRLDQKADLHAFVTLIYRVLYQLEAQIKAGRRF